MKQLANSPSSAQGQQLTRAGNMQLAALDFGPVGEADVTANLMEYAPCGPVRHELAEVPHDPDALPYLHIKAAHHGAASDVLTQVEQGYQPCTGLSYSQVSCVIATLRDL